MKSRTENVNKNLTFRSDIDEPIISTSLSTIESIITQLFCTSDKKNVFLFSSLNLFRIK